MECDSGDVVALDVFGRQQARRDFGNRCEIFRERKGGDIAFEGDTACRSELVGAFGIAHAAIEVGEVVENFGHEAQKQGILGLDGERMLRDREGLLPMAKLTENVRAPNERRHIVGLVLQQRLELWQSLHIFSSVIEPLRLDKERLCVGVCVHCFPLFVFVCLYFVVILSSAHARYG